MHLQKLGCSYPGISNPGHISNPGSLKLRMSQTPDISHPTLYFSPDQTSHTPRCLISTRSNQHCEVHPRTTERTIRPPNCVSPQIQLLPASAAPGPLSSECGTCTLCISLSLSLTLMASVLLAFFFSLSLCLYLSLSRARPASLSLSLTLYLSLARSLSLSLSLSPSLSRARSVSVTVSVSVSLFSCLSLAHPDSVGALGLALLARLHQNRVRPQDA